MVQHSPSMAEQL